MRKISIIGAGNVGPTSAFLIAINNIADVVLVDVVEGIAEGRALDMMHSQQILNFNSNIIGTADYSMIKNSEIVIITAGMSRKPGMTREELFEKNHDIIKAICKEINKYAPESIVIVVTNPLDLMCKVAFNELKVRKKRILGLSGLLDTARLKHYASEKGMKAEDSMVIGSHDGNMVLLFGKLREKMQNEELKEIEQKTKNAGSEIVRLSGSSYYGPAACIAFMADSILNDKKSLISACAYIEGEYGYQDVFIGVPIILGKNGVEKIIEIKLEKEEKEQFERSVKRLKELYAELKL